MNSKKNRTTFRYVVRFKHEEPNAGLDPHSSGLLQDARALGFQDIGWLEAQELYFIQGRLDEANARRLGLELLCDPITQAVEWEQMDLAGSSSLPAQPESGEAQLIEIALRAGVTDPVADEIVRAAGEMGIQGVEQASTGRRVWVRGEHLDAARLDELARRLLANPVIHRYAVGLVEPVFPLAAVSTGRVEPLAIRGASDAELLEVSRLRRAALDLAEMQAIQSYCDREGRDLSDVEFECIAQTWSEHCVHKTFKARITLSDGRVVDNLMRTYLKAATEQIAAPWVLSAFQDNAGIIDLDGENEISFKVETHNHPSAIEPFGGANTGVGGVIRDVIGVSAKPIGNTDVLCFGPINTPVDRLPAGVLHPRRIFSGVVAGVQDYGNKIGIPTVNGAILFDEGYTSNPLVFCGCVGIAPQGLHVRQPRPGDRVVVIGGRTGRDGLRGATFSSQTMDAQTGVVAGASVQIGVPITEKGLIEVCLRARDARLYTAITDCGAGGLSSAIGEMASTCGADVDLAAIPLKYPGLAPWEIWLSEAQERMVLAVPEQHMPALRDICQVYGVELTDAGGFTGSGRLVVRYETQIVLDLENAFLHEGIPQRLLKAAVEDSPTWVEVKSEPYADLNLSQALLGLLNHPNIASKSAVIRIYDHEVQGGTVIKPLTGAANDGPSDGCVLKPLGTRGNVGVVLSNGINPEYGKVDAYRMAVSVLDEAVRNAVAVGADPDRLAVLDNFCWGDPTVPETLGSLLEAARGCYDAALANRTPFISGKDSLNNAYLGSDGKRHSIPPTLLISAMGVIPDITRLSAWI
jgi:phosphoribosylformylglycinamidine synthase